MCLTVCLAVLLAFREALLAGRRVDVSIERRWSDICGLFARTVKSASVSVIQIRAFCLFCCRLRRPGRVGFFYKVRSENCGKRLLASSCPSTWNNSAPAGRILTKFGI